MVYIRNYKNLISRLRRVWFLRPLSLQVGPSVTRSWPVVKNYIHYSLFLVHFDLCKQQTLQFKNTRDVNDLAMIFIPFSFLYLCDVYRPHFYHGIKSKLFISSPQRNLLSYYRVRMLTFRAYQLALAFIVFLWSISRSYSELAYQKSLESRFQIPEPRF